MKTLTINKTSRFNVTRVNNGTVERFTMSGQSLAMLIRAIKRSTSIQVAFNGREIELALPSSTLYVRISTGLTLSRGPAATRFSLLSSIEDVLLDKVPAPRT